MEGGGQAATESTTPTPPPSIAGGRLSPFVLLCVVGFLGRLSYEMLRSPITSLFAEKIGAPTEIIGLLVASVTITGIFVKLPSGGLADLFGFRRLMQAGLWVKATAPFLYLLVAIWPVLLAVRFYHGLSTALYAPAASAQVAKFYPTERGKRLGIYGAAENAGVVLGPVLGASVLAWSSFSVAFVVSGIIGILALLAVMPLPKDNPPKAARKSVGEITSGLIAGVRQIIGDPAIRLVSLMEATLYTSVGTLQAYLPLYALTRHISIAQIGLIFGGQGIASIVSRPFMGSAADRLGRRPFIMIGVTLCAAVLVAIPFIGSFWTLLGLAVLFGLGTGMVTPSTTAMIGDLVKRGDFGAAMGVFGSLWDVGHASGPLVAGVLIVWLGYQAAFGIIAATILAALAVFVLGSRDPKFGSK
ncbi:MFS transporter [Acidisoma sp. S159]|uniref:MFS transporter n=1 Tax=Acidisoma sp. S159 TaxID=1747225 RepID=UPI001C201924|nr:MFS transporter [Acidisoma sp. S159]